MYKEASRLGTRFPTTKGMLSVEQLWSLTVNELDKLAVSLQEAYESSKGKSFLAKRSVKDKGLKLQFDIVIDILNTKVEEQEVSKEAAEVKAHNEKILNALTEVEGKSLLNKTPAQLKAMLK